MRFLPSKHQLHETSKQPFQCKMQSWITKLYGTAHGSCKDHLRVALTMGATFAPSERKRSASHTRRTNEVPPINAGSHFMRENTGFRAISTLQACPRRNVQASLTSLLSLSTSLLYSTLSTSLLSPHPYSLHISALSTSLLSPHPYSFHIPTPLTSLISSLL